MRSRWWVMRARRVGWLFLVRARARPDGWTDGEVVADPVLGPFSRRRDADDALSGAESVRRVMEG